MSPRASARCQKLSALADLLLVPQRTILVVEEHDLAVAQPGGSARVVQQHQGQQREHLALVGHELGECSSELDRFCGEVDAAASPALVEHEVDHGEDRRQPVRELVVGRYGERDAGVADLVLRPRQSLAHRLERDEEGERDLFGGQAAKGAQGQRDLRIQARVRGGSR